MSSSRGFTLLEVMVAMAICALAGIAAMKAVGDHINHLSNIEEQQLASWVAENQLAELTLTTSWPPSDGKTGDEEQAGVKFYWRHKITKTESNDLLEARVVVYSDEARKHDVYELITYITKNGAN
ncbi:type II secretion system minor pseudopilin GspI [Pseudoalteromonas piratica]|jgi:general secretion pathway protein I|uniref:Type II secretion system protein I n=1 Tax=Pseudoalteromonas piratica TaxID=1348114 RepID=A0A0A7EEJ3_9GAMM|nr:type II secretion system minor pseudopilin GspI [Pseudoalteromonas piratica]AIY64486.1 general secretion pathway protein GspI [Pseudoalteromonas piratica]